jgi:predicted TIM-barrel fold metal-dependent hydrolase
VTSVATLAPLFDAHLHILDPRFPLMANEGFLPEPFRVADYRATVAGLGLGVTGGAVVSGSFQGYDQTYLTDALALLGPTFVGVAQLPATTAAADIERLDALGVRALRFNLHRGVHPSPDAMVRLAHLAYETAGWHAELYLDVRDLPDLSALTDALPALCVDHLGLSAEGRPHLLRLVERGAHVKATGFGRLALPIAETLRAVALANPDALLFGTDLPGTRAPRPFRPEDLLLLAEALGDEALVRKAVRENALALYRPRAIEPRNGSWPS